LIRESGSLAVELDVSFFFMPSILAQKAFLLSLSASVLGFGAGAFRLPPVARL
jgi:hypothetical protein